MTIINEMKEIIKQRDAYSKAYDILMQYWDSLPDEDKPEIDKQLTKLGL